jgi:hypothetical protein
LKAIAAALLFLVGTAAAAQQAAPAASGFSALGGTVFATTKHDPAVGLSYPVAQGGSLTRRMAGWEIDGLMMIEPTGNASAQQGAAGLPSTLYLLGLGGGYGFQDFMNGAGSRVKFTIGPAYLIPLHANRGQKAGLGAGLIGVFARISLTPPTVAAK